MEIILPQRKYGVMIERPRKSHLHSDFKACIGNLTEGYITYAWLNNIEDKDIQWYLDLFTLKSEELLSNICII